MKILTSLFDTPLHILLRQYRVLQIILTAFLMLLTWKFSIWIMMIPFGDLGAGQVAVIATAFPSLIAGLFGLVNSISKKNESDDFK